LELEGLPWAIGALSNPSNDQIKRPKNIRKNLPKFIMEFGRKQTLRGIFVTCE
jgi:hypothetical protein